MTRNSPIEKYIMIIKLRVTSYKLRVTGIFILFVLMTFSCSQDTKISTFTTSYGDFVNSLMVEGIVEPLSSITITTPRNLFDSTVSFIIEDGEYVEEGQVVCTSECQNLQNQYDQFLLSLENAEAGINKTKADLNMQFALLEAQVKTNEADTKIAQMDSLQLAYASPNQRAIKEFELEKSMVEKVRYEKKIEALKVVQQSEIKKLELEIQRFKMTIGTMKEQLDALTFKAPRSGMIIRAISRTTGKKLQVGDVVWGNFQIATMPEFKQMKVVISAPEADFKFMSVNDSVYYTFDAMPNNKGTGKILKKAPVGQPYKRGSNVKFFEVEASIDKVDSMPEPGFSANCKVINKQVENVISVPQIAIFDEDSIKVVFVQRKHGFERRQVLTDTSSPKEAIITAGLTEGEVIALSKPKTKHIKKWTTLTDSLLEKQEAPVDAHKRDSLLSDFDFFSKIMRKQIWINN